MAFQCFSQDNIDVQVIEVGLGGRLDATNVLNSAVCVVTSISLDHTAVLGDTIEEIAAEKAGIIKPGATVIVAPQVPQALSQILSVCEKQDATPILVGRDITWKNTYACSEGQNLTVKGLNAEYDLHIPLLGSYQMENAASAVAALEALGNQGVGVPRDAMKMGFENVNWPCRMEVLSRSPS
ncbi:MAG: hypothetical protein CM1200mP22_33170 [Dehalococcoidia bacterium]|nr:MAG: hypothetical protein CM1200mP22_33170 [Dehalococcoidia bacterium]